MEERERLCLVNICHISVQKLYVITASQKGLTTLWVEKFELVVFKLVD